MRPGKLCCPSALACPNEKRRLKRAAACRFGTAEEAKLEESKTMSDWLDNFHWCDGYLCFLGLTYLCIGNGVRSRARS